MMRISEYTDHVILMIFCALSFFEVGEEMSFFDMEGGDGGGE